MQLLAFLCCERVIFDQQGVPSLIMIMETLTVQVPPGTDIPSNVVAPKEWAVFTLWIPESQDIGKTFRQIIEVEPPPGGGARMKPPPLEFRVKADEQYRNLMPVLGFPVGHKGRYNVKMRLESDGELIGSEYTYKIEVKHQHQDQTVSA
ncbi:MAG TPA: hypothetical protein VF493_15710 [Terriglobales bacterium]